MEGAAPDLVRAVVGFRQWRLGPGATLASTHAGGRWDAGLVVAACPHHPAPAPGCTCGLHAWYAPVPRTASAATADLVAGAITAWGRLELHPRGFRAECAVVVALALPLSRGGKRRRVAAAAAALGVPAVPARALARTAAEHGDPVPPALRPPDLTPSKRAQPFPGDPARRHAAVDRGRR